MNEALEARVAGIIATHARRPVEDLRPEVTLDALGLDSVSLVEMVFAIEEAFDIGLPLAPEPGADMASVGGVIAAVRGLVAARGS